MYSYFTACTVDSPNGYYNFTNTTESDVIAFTMKGHTNINGTLNAYSKTGTITDGTITITF